MTSLLEDKLSDFALEFVASYNYSLIYNLSKKLVLENDSISKEIVDSYESSSTDFLFRSYLQGKSIKTLKLWQKQSLVLAFMGFGINDDNLEANFLSLASNPLSILGGYENSPILIRKAIFLEDKALSLYDCDNWEGIASSHYNIAKIIEDYINLNRKNMSKKYYKGWFRRNTSEYCQAGDIFMLDYDESMEEVSIDMAFKSYLYGTINFLKMYYLYDDRTFFDLAKYPHGKMDEIIETNYLIEDDFLQENYDSCLDYFKKVRVNIGFTF